MHASLIRAGLAVLVLVSAAGAQCTVLVKETFRHGERPHGGDGRLRLVEMEENLNGYWAQVGGRWINADDGQSPHWYFNVSSPDPVEMDEDEYSPVADTSGSAIGSDHAAAVLPFTPPATRFTCTAEFIASSASGYLGFTSSPQVLSNFETHGTLWISLDGNGDWAIRANGSQLVASGNAPSVGTLQSGWYRVQLSFDPVASTVDGIVFNTVLPSTHVVLTRPMAFVGIEAPGAAALGLELTVNNLIVRTDQDPTVITTGPSRVCIGDTATLHATATLTEPAFVRWQDEWGNQVLDGPRYDGSIVSGSETLSMTIENIAPAESGHYSCVGVNECGMSHPGFVSFTIGACGPCPADFNQDGGVDGSDVEAFFASWEAGEAVADTNVDGGVDGGDIETFFAAWQAGGC